MDFLDNPFYILDVTPQDNRRKIMEQSEERSLVQNPDVCRTAAATLTHPRRRLYAEISWLPCTRLNHVEEIFELLHDYSFGTIELTPVAHANLVTAKLQRLPDYSADEVANRIRQIARSFEDVNAEQLGVAINVQRKASRFPIVNLQDIESEIQDLGDYYRKVIISALEKLSAKQRAAAMTSAVALATRRGGQVPRLINRLIDWYEVDAQKSLDEHKTKIAELNDKLRLAANEERPDSSLAPVVTQLIQSVKDWDVFAQPIQVSRKSQGKSHDVSVELAGSVRELALHFIEYGKVDICQQLINMLKEVFAEVSEVATIIDEDTKSLNEISQRYTIIMQGVKQFKNIKEQVDKVQTAVNTNRSDAMVSSMVEDLIQSVNKWDASAQPMEANIAVTNLVRGLALHLWNEHGKLDFSLQLTNALQEVFAGVADIANRIAEDKTVLAGLVVQQAFRARKIETSNTAGNGCLLQLGIILSLGLLGTLGCLFQGC